VVFSVFVWVVDLLHTVKGVPMKQAFTMIELIFVIVIIGILAAVAIPKLAATRTDAEVVSLANSITAAANEVASFAVSQGVPSQDIPAMSKIATTMIAQKKATFSNGVLRVKIHSVADCIRLSVVKSNDDMNLTMSYGNAGSDEACQALQGAVDAADYPIPLRGRVLEY
jgi:general secretion pathway protein G